MRILKYTVIILLGMMMLQCGKIEGRDEDQGKPAKAQQTSSDASIKRYPVESGIIEYTLSGLTAGTETIYFVDWGRHEAKYIENEISMMGITQRQKTLTILKGDSLFSYDYLTGKTTRMKSPTADDMKQNMAGRDINEIGYDMMEQMGGKVIGSEEIAGKTCEIWEISAILSKAWIWNGITLKTEAGADQMRIVSEAIRFEENVNIPEDKLRFPEGVDPEGAQEIDLDKIRNMMKALPGGQ